MRHPTAADDPADPMPQPPAAPDPDACCHSGCTWCVLELYEEELERYRSALAAWQARHTSRGEIRCQL